MDSWKPAPVTGREVLNLVADLTRPGTSDEWVLGCEHTIARMVRNNAERIATALDAFDAAAKGADGSALLAAAQAPVNPPPARNPQPRNPVPTPTPVYANGVCPVCGLPITTAQRARVASGGKGNQILFCSRCRVIFGVVSGASAT